MQSINNSTMNIRLNADDDLVYLLPDGIKMEKKYITT